MKPSSKSASEDTVSLRDIVVLDACVLLNLYASERVEEILASFPFRCLIAPQVRHEVLWYFGSSEVNHGQFERREIALEPLVATRRIEVMDLSEAEEAVFVDFAQHLGDGEAASGALAIGRTASVATDDFKAIQLFQRLTPPLHTIGTPTLLRCWASRSGVAQNDVARTLHAIYRGARFSPRPDAADVSWWHKRLREISRR